ncbi:MAG: hypothetical protein ABEH38_02130 [Flavobacteriales bacterium]
MKALTSILFFLFLFSGSFSVVANGRDSLMHRKRKDALALYKAMKESDSNAVRDSLGTELDEAMKGLLECKGAYGTKFPELRKRIGILYAPDSSFRLFNWNVAYTNGTHDYFAYILRKRDNGKTELIDLDPMRNAAARNKKKGGGIRKRKLERRDLKAKEWTPALYYRIIRKERKGKPFYTLLGWEGKDALTTRKIIEVLRFDDKGRPQFGSPVFKKKKESKEEKESWREVDRERRKRVRRQGERSGPPPKQRIIFEFTDDAIMTLKYEKGKDRIVFNQLVPERPDLKGMYEFYGPDLLFNAYVWKSSGYWSFEKKVKPENDSRSKTWNDPDPEE